MRIADFGHTRYGQAVLVNVTAHRLPPEKARNLLVSGPKTKSDDWCGVFEPKDDN